MFKHTKEMTVLLVVGALALVRHGRLSPLSSSGTGVP